MATGKCPKCEKIVPHLRLEGLDANVAFGAGGWKAITLCCPFCSTILSAAIDPIAVKADIVNAIKKKG
ncbi:hypothetical protein ABIA22_002269 [Sinorhizobium fredii]|uniref:hypothetical protein n=1 Tax=Rhizobium fredii TaxID=380 RepID=UPI0035143201